MPTEIKFMTALNYWIAEYGPAKHENIPNKGRPLQSIPPKVHLRDYDSIKTFFKPNPDRLKTLQPDETLDIAIILKVPGYIEMDQQGNTTILQKSANFKKFYEGQLSSLPIEMQTLYYIGLQLYPDFFDQFPDEASYKVFPRKSDPRRKVLEIIHRVHSLEMAKTEDSRDVK